MQVVPAWKNLWIVACRRIGGLAVPGSGLLRIFSTQSGSSCSNLCNPKGAQSPRFALHRPRGVRSAGQTMLEMTCLGWPAPALGWSGQGKGCGTALSARRIQFESSIICRFLLCLSSLGRPCHALLNKH